MKKFVCVLLLLIVAGGATVGSYKAIDSTKLAGVTPTAAGLDLLDDATVSNQRTTLGLAIGTNVQAYDADLTTFAGITPSPNVQTLLSASSYATFRASLSLGTLCLQDSSAVGISGGTINGLSIPLPIASGGTGASTLTGIVKGNGTSAFTAAAAGTDYLAINGSGAALTALNAGNISSGTLAVARGGTGTTTVDAARVALLNVDLLTGLVLYYKFDNNVTDSSSSGLNGTVTGTTTYVSGSLNSVLNQAFSFDGSTKITATGTPGTPANISISVWVNIVTPDSLGCDVIEIGNTSAAIRVDATGSQNTIQFITQIAGPSYPSLDYVRQLAGIGWHHICCVFDDTNNYWSIWIDGVCVKQTTTTNSILWNGGNTVVGSHPSISTIDVTGTLDDLRVYNFALTPLQIMTLASPAMRP